MMALPPSFDSSSKYPVLVWIHGGPRGSFRNPFLDKDRIAVGGLAYGGFLTNWLMANSTRFRCSNIESQSLPRDYGKYRWESGLDGPPWIPKCKWNDQYPYRLSDNWKIPVLVVGGERDYRVPLNELIVLPDEGHGITKPENQKFLFKEITDWLAKHLG